MILSNGAGGGQRPWNGMDERKLRKMFARRRALYETACGRRFVVHGSAGTEEAVVEFAVWLQADL